MEIRRKIYYKLKNIFISELKNSQYDYKQKLRGHINRQSRWLDLGCGHQILPRWMPNSESEENELVSRCKTLIGLDYQYYSLKRQKIVKYKVVGNIQDLPFNSCSFNLITANLVLEHVHDPIKSLKEIHRILEPNGIFIFHTPNLLNFQSLAGFLVPKTIKNNLIKFLEGRKEEDTFHTYYRINTPSKVKKLAKKIGFSILKLELINSSPETVMLGPIVIIELLIIRILEWNVLKNLRSNLIAVLQKSDVSRKRVLLRD